MIKVLKFGGSSLVNSDTRKSVINRIEEQSGYGTKLVVVVSAMGRYPDMYSTDALKRLTSAKNKDLDLIMSVGETISTVVLASELRESGFNVSVLNAYQLGIMTCDNYNDARVLNLNNEFILDSLNESDIIIAPGFQGVTDDYSITTLGRGGSDLTAVLLSKMLNCNKVYIYSDVLGMYSGNPKEQKEARLFKEVCYDDALIFAYQGAKVIHYKAVEEAKENNIEIHLRSTFSDITGTIIKENVQSRLLNIVSSTKDLVQVYIRGKNNIQIKTEELTNKLCNAHISLDMVDTYPKLVSFVINKTDEVETKEIIKKYSENESEFKDVSKVSYVGNFNNSNQILSKIMTVLNNNNIKVFRTSTTNTSIWILVSPIDENEAKNIIHSKFINQNYDI